MISEGKSPIAKDSKLNNTNTTEKEANKHNCKRTIDSLNGITDLISDTASTQSIDIVAKSFLNETSSIKKEYCNHLQLNELRLLSGNLCLFDNNNT